MSNLRSALLPISRYLRIKVSDSLASLADELLIIPNILNGLFSIVFNIAKKNL